MSINDVTGARVARGRTADASEGKEPLLCFSGSGIVVASY